MKEPSPSELDAIAREAWAIELPHKHAHPSGCPGIFAFAPSDMRTYHDNIVVTAN